MSSNKFGVIVGVQGQAQKIVMVGSGATVKSALTAAKLDPATFGGSLTLNGEPADLSDRVKRNDLILATPKVAGGR